LNHSKMSLMLIHGFKISSKSISTIGGMAVSLRRYLFEIPLASAVDKYLGFTLLNPLESATDLAKPKYLATSLKVSRYRLKEMGITGFKYSIQVKPVPPRWHRGLDLKYKRNRTDQRGYQQ